MDLLEGYCLKCKEKRPIVNPQPEWATNGSPATRGTCAICGTNIYLRGRTPAHDLLPKPEAAAAPPQRTVKKATVTKTATKKGKTAAAKKSKATTKGKVAAKIKPRSNGNGGDKTPITRTGKLVVVESPAKARTIGRYLGRGYTVKSSVGHVRDLLKSRLSVDIDNGFAPDYRVPKEKKEVVAELKDAAARAKEIYLATDPDREGEAIAWHVLESADMDPQRTQRVVFHEITKDAILNAFAHPRPIDMDRVNAQQARRILDRLVGYKLSPLLWRKIRGRLSAGRVQSVAVRLVVEREREIENFVTEEYWTLKAELSQEKYNRTVPRPGFIANLSRYQGEDLPLKSEAEVRPHLDALEKATWTVGKVKIGTRRRNPAAPFTTSTLQQEASRQLNFNTSKTMRVAQQLYEGVEIDGADGRVGLITYMRTDSVTVSKEAQAQARGYIKDRFGANYMPAHPPVYKTRAKAAQEAHEAIRPTAVFRDPKTVKSGLTRDQFRLYELIWSRFVASQMSPAIYDTVTADIHAGEVRLAPAKRAYLFRATGSTLRFAGFLALYEETSPSDKPDDDSNQVPADLNEGEGVDLLRLLPEQHFTQPPPRFSEATLVKELEENGIGRPSTYAAILSTVQDRGYVETRERRLIPTEIGQLVNDMLVEHFPDVMSVDFTARLEDDLDAIAEGKPWVPVLDEFYSRFAERLAAADEAVEKVEIKRELEPVGRECPLCGNPLVYREGRFGRFIGCSTFPTCRHTEQILVKLGVSCPKCKGDLIEKKSRRGKTFYGCANYPDCDWTSWKKPLPQPCHHCGGLLLQVDRSNAECTQCSTKQSIGRSKAKAV
ncbi:MAG: type I DNA topoisomerase [Anaerolineae bacterium]|nr:type I DNA topoisomerase [Anaerolineae bacterium]